MKSSITFLSAVLSLLWAAQSNAQAEPTQSLSLKTPKQQGCFSSSANSKDQGSYIYQTSGYCQKTCVGQGKPVMVLSEGSHCWCGDLLPDPGTKIDDSKCNSPCTGYDKQTCGGSGTFAVWLTGTSDNVDSVSDNSASASGRTTSRGPGSPTPTTAAQPSTITEAGRTIVVTAPGSASAATGKSSGGTNKAGVAAGVVVGVVALASILGAAWLFLRTRKRRAVEEEYRRNAAVSSIVGSRKPESSSTVSDARLEPSVMMQRRQSDGSIADNQDYSRRILKVTNPDGT